MTLAVAETKAKLSEIPTLSLDVLTQPGDKRDALKLIADSVAQQRQTASRSLIFHPICVSILALALSIGHYVTATASGRRDAGVFITTYGGLVLSYLLTIRYFTGPYIHLAEETDWKQWLRGPGEADDLVLGARFGSDIIGALVLRFERSPAKVRPLKSKALIRAWTIKNRYRGKGLGGDMLSEAVSLSKSTLGGESRDVEVAFPEDHANSATFLYRVFNTVFLTRDERAGKALKKALEQQRVN